MDFKLTWAFHTDGLPFDGSPIVDKSLGGSESALWSMARELARRGNRVEVFCNCPAPGRYDGVDYYDRKTFIRRAGSAEWDIFVAHRFYGALNIVSRTKMNWIWLHDMPVDVKLMCAHLFATDQVITLSDFHTKAHTKDAPDLEKIIWQSRNGVDLALVDSNTAGAERDKKLFVYASRPERGLGRLLVDIWPKLYENDPGRRLVITTYDTMGWGVDAGLKRHYEDIERLIAITPGVISKKALSKRELYRLYASAGAVLYPTSFPEISCITALEAMACGTPIVTTADFALTETIPYGGVPYHLSPTYKEDFINRVEFIISDELEYKKRQKQGRAWVNGHYQWSQIAAEWEGRAHALFRQRSLHTKKVFDQLVYNSDLVAARELAKQRSWGSQPTWDDTDHWDNALPWLDNILAAHHEEPDAYSDGAGEQINAGWDENQRFAEIASMVPQGPLTVIDVGCGGAGLLARIHRDRPNLKLEGMDFSPALIERGQAFFEQAFPGDPNPPKLFVGELRSLVSVTQIDRREPRHHPYDVVICSEVLEHQIGTKAFIDDLEKLCTKSGTIILTVPSGPWEAISFTKPFKESKNDWNHNRFHVHHFEQRDLEEIFGAKKNLKITFRAAGLSPRGEMLGWWFISYMKSAAETGEVDYNRKFQTTRPYKKLAYCMIVKNEEDNLHRNLKTIYDVVDEIHILDTGSTDETKNIVRAWQAEGRYLPKIFLHEAAYENIRPPRAGEHAEPVTQNEINNDRYIETNHLIAFDRARNLSTKWAIERDADWILWADADEVFKGGMNLRKYLYTKLSPALVIHQHHQTIDPNDNPGVDTPFRCFQPNLGVQFYGTIHEQPAFGVNQLPEPALTLPDVDIVHFGYLDKGTIRRKCIERNMTLVAKDRYLYPTRALGKLNVLRDMVHLAQFELEKTGGVPTEKAVTFLRSACTMHLENFTDQKGPYFRHSVKLYDRALMLLAMIGIPLKEGRGIPFEAQVQIAVVPGGITENMAIPGPQRLWCSSREEFVDAVVKQCNEIFRKFGGVYADSGEGPANGHRRADDPGDPATGSPVHPASGAGSPLRDDPGPAGEGRTDNGDVRAEAEAGGAG